MQKTFISPFMYNSPPTRVIRMAGVLHPFRLYYFHTVTCHGRPTVTGNIQRTVPRSGGGGGGGGGRGGVVQGGRIMNIYGSYWKRLSRNRMVMVLHCTITGRLKSVFFWIE
jgi:hypothetical protein